MVEPRFIVQTLAYLDERGEVVCPQVQPVVRAAKIKTSVLTQSSFRVLAQMTTKLLVRGHASEPGRFGAGIDMP